MDILNDFMIGSVNRNQPEISKDNAVLDQDDFLKIIAATISNPPIPGSGEGGAGGEMDFMGQMIQMNLLDQVSELTTSIESTMMMTQQQQALSLVGKEVTVAGEEAELITGIVEKVRFRPDGFATIQIDGVEYSLQNVTEVGQVGTINSEVDDTPVVPEIGQSDEVIKDGEKENDT